MGLAQGFGKNLAIFPRFNFTNKRQENIFLQYSGGKKGLSKTVKILSIKNRKKKIFPNGQSMFLVKNGLTCFQTSQFFYFLNFLLL